MFSTTQVSGSQGDDVLYAVLSHIRDELKALADVPLRSLDDDQLSSHFDRVLALKAALDELMAWMIAASDKRFGEGARR